MSDSKKKKSLKGRIAEADAKKKRSKGAQFIYTTSR